ncbi:MAG: hypothetical protein E7Z70_07260 [Thermoplasmata archaeon]|nr:hypothetical protein [Thermoplasmata archaeon]WII06888.1 hypothetical protein PED39_04685 [Methanomassiliicoccales archaeon LGM-RCC1]
MNTKGIKFLAVLAVLAFAFAAFAVALPAQENEAAAWGAIEATEAAEGAVDQTSGNKILVADREYTIAPNKVSGTYGIFLLDGASITIEKGSATTFTSPGIIVGAATKTVANNEATYNYANASKIVFANQILADYVIENDGGVIKITSTSTYLTQNNITVTDNHATWGGEFAIGDVKILEKGELLDVIITGTKLYAGIDNATTEVTDTVTVIQQASNDIQLEARGDLYLNGGMEIKKTDGATGEITFTSAAGATTTGQIQAFDNKIVLDACNGGYTATGGVITSIAAGKMSLNEGTFTTPSGGNFTVTGALTIGKNATLNYGYANAGAGALTIADNSSLILYGTLNAKDGATLAITNNGDGTNDGKFAAYSGAIFGQGVYTTMAASDVSLGSAMKDVEMTTELTSDFTGNQIQNIVITKDLVIRPGVTLAILGKLTVNPGVTLTVSDTATLILGGTVYNEETVISNLATADIQGEIDAKKTTVANTGLYFLYGNGFNITGTITTDAPMDVNAKTTFKSGSLLTVTSNGTLLAGDATSINFASGSKGVIEGTLEYTAASAAVNVAGTFDIDGTVKLYAGDSDKSYIYTVGNGAKVILSSVKFTDLGDNEDDVFVIADVGTSMKNSEGTSITIAAGNTITVTRAGTVTGTQILSGLTVTQTAALIDSYGVEKLSSKLDLSGSVSSGTANVITITLTDGNVATNVSTGMTVSDMLSIGEKVQFTDYRATLTISGTMYKTVTGDPIDFREAGTYGPYVTVTGLLSVINKDTITQINAAYYEETVMGIKYYNYTSLENALQIGKDFKLLGNIYVYGDVEIPAPIKVDASGATIYVGDGDYRNAKLTVKDGAKLTINEAIVNGSLVFEDYTTGKKVGEIISDVFTTNGNYQVFTNLYTALAAAEPGDIITVTKDTAPVVLDKSVTIPALVTVELDAGKALKLNDGVVLTVNGTLSSWDALQTETGSVFVNNPTLATSGEVRLIVNGVFATVADASYAKYAATGAYYTYTDSDATYNMITDFEVVPLFIDDKAKPVTIYGDETATDVEIAGDYKISVVIPAGQSLSMGTLTLAKAQISAPTDATKPSFTGTIGSEEGAVKFANAQGFTVEEKTVKGESMLFVTGTITKGKGTADLSVSASKGIVYVTGTLDVSSFTVAADTTLVVDGSNNNAKIENGSTATINGTLYVTDGGIFVNSATEVKKGVQVLGALIIADSDSEAGTAAGSATIAKLYVGVKRADVDKRGATTAASAYVSASVIAGLKEAFVLEGSTISEEVVDGMVVSKFVVENAAYLTVYTLSNSVLTAGDIVCPHSEEVDFEYWTYTSSGTVYKATGTALTTSRTYTALIDYDVFTLIVKTDDGVKSVAVDGRELINLGNNVYVSYTKQYSENGMGFKMSAGKYVLSFTLKDGYEGSPVLYDAEGKAVLGGYGITITGDADHRDVTFQLSGTEKEVTPEPTPVEQNEWTITTILLVILVILIAVMAVIVALRLNRS